MTKNQTIIRAIENCVDNPRCKDCPWVECESSEHKRLDVPLGLILSILEVLKAQEPVKPRIVDTSNSKLYHNDMFKNYYCGNCGEFLRVVNRKDLFCSQCGKAVKWE